MVHARRTYISLVNRLIDSIAQNTVPDIHGLNPRLTGPPDLRAIPPVGGPGPSTLTDIEYKRAFPISSDRLLGDGEASTLLNDARRALEYWLRSPTATLDTLSALSWQRTLHDVVNRGSPKVREQALALLDQAKGYQMRPIFIRAEHVLKIGVPQSDSPELGSFYAMLRALQTVSRDVYTPAVADKAADLLSQIHAKYPAEYEDFMKRAVTTRADR